LDNDQILKEDNMKAVDWTVGISLALIICMVFFARDPAVRSAQKENHCFTCHTNPRKLIAITREIAKTNKDKPGGSPETKGEG
jgi:hypothetical protein